MSRLDDLIRELCPDGVEFKELGDKSLFHFHYGKGNKIPKNGGAYPVYGCNGIVSSTDTYNCENVSIIGHIGSAGIVNWCSGKAFVTYNGTIADIKDKSKLDSRYLYYVLLSLNLPTYVKGSQPFLSASDFAKVRIPIPPLEVQKEIVRLLDDFTAKTAELQAELNKEYEARKKQYEYYRDTLLNDEKTTRKVTLQDVAQYSKARISSSEVNETNYVGVDNLLQNKKGKVNSTHVPTSGNLTEFQSGDILIGNIRPYLQKIWLSDKTGGTNGDVLDIRPNQKLVTPPFLYQVLASDRFFNYDMQNSKGAKMPRGNKEKVMEYTFALPTLERQREIVLLLNKFEIAFNDLQSELPAEIESRQKQYEYYRDKLLTFKELK